MMTVATPEEIRRRFTYHAPKGDQAERHAALSDMFIELATNACNLTPESREQSLMLTHLEQAKFFASAAIARRE